MQPYNIRVVNMCQWKRREKRRKEGMNKERKEGEKTKKRKVNWCN